jgi:hypothetical protein
MGNGRRIFERPRQKVSKAVSFAGNRPILGIIRLCGIVVGSFYLLKRIGCSAGECCMTIATVAMVFVTYQGNRQNKASIEASQKQAEAAIQSLQETQKQWKEEYRPRLAVYFVGGSEDAFWNLIVENIGKTSAYDAEASCDSFQCVPEYPRKRSYLPPGRKEILDKVYLNPGDRDVTNHKKLHLKLRYTDHNKKQFEESVEVFFSNRWSL